MTAHIKLRTKGELSDSGVWFDPTLLLYAMASPKMVRSTA